MNATNKKMTRIQALEIAISTIQDVEAVEVLKAIQVSIEKSNARKSATGNTKKTEASNKAMHEVIDLLNKDEFLSYSQLEIDFSQLSNQKFTALMKKAVEQGLAEKGKAENKKVGYKLI